MNNQFSEHIGCSIFHLCGFETQETTMGYFTAPTGKRKLVVACKDFTQNGEILYEFSKLANQVQVEGKYGTSIESVYNIISSNSIIGEKENMISRFWDMFVIDTLIGNSDRHFDNWGIIERNQNISFAPIYDCGSSLAALVDDSVMKELLSDERVSAFKNREYNISSCYSMNGQRIFYHSIFRNPTEELLSAVKRIVPQINIASITELIDETPEMADVRKEYIKKAVCMRYEQILMPTYKRAMKQQIK